MCLGSLVVANPQAKNNVHLESCCSRAVTACGDMSSALGPGHGMPAFCIRITLRYLSLGIYGTNAVMGSVYSAVTQTIS